MPNSKNNTINKISGRTGNLLIFCRVDGKRIVSKVSEQSKIASEKQLVFCDYFQSQTVFTVESSPTTNEHSKPIVERGISFRIIVSASGYGITQNKDNFDENKAISVSDLSENAMMKKQIVNYIVTKGWTNLEGANVITRN